MMFVCLIDSGMASTTPLVEPLRPPTVAKISDREHIVNTDLLEDMTSVDCGEGIMGSSAGWRIRLTRGCQLQ